MSKDFSYRSDIDGLRAVAVLIVIFFHANFTWITGGYVGVDVFFVISGFLITNTIEKEILQNTFSFKQFYLRRIRRIIPVLFFILLLCTIPAYFMFASDFEAFARTLIHTIVSTNNIHLWINNKQYFAENSELVPLLHTWSLSVEEQFYFIWPAILLLLSKLKSITIKRVAILSTLVLSLLYSIYLTNADPNTAYFLLQGRFFELGIGATLAVFWHSIPLAKKMVNNILSIAGLLLILIPAVFLQKESSFPGLNALWPCLGAAILIYSNKGNDTNGGYINTVLKNNIIVLIGTISYSMYLWHWPIFAFLKYFGVELTGVIRIGSLLIIFILSYFSWRYIEQPFRTTIKFNFKKTLLYVLLPVVLISVSIYAVVDKFDGFPERFPTLTEFNPKENYPNNLRKNCFDKFKIGNCEECFLGMKKDSLDGVLIGDSYANHTAAFLDVLAKDAKMYIHDSAAGGYPILVNHDDQNKPTKDEKYGLERLEYAKKFGTIFIAANWDGLSRSKINSTRILNNIEELVKLNKKIVVFDCLRVLPEMKLHKLMLTKAYPKNYNESYIFVPKPRTRDYLVYQIHEKFPQVIIIDMNASVKIDKTHFTTQINNSIVYRNEDHLNTSGARLIGEKYLKLHTNPLKQLDKK
jgi:peptidoglycan/LPS O-acetylase OafA/YrhL